MSVVHPCLVRLRGSSAGKFGSICITRTPTSFATTPSTQESRKENEMKKRIKIGEAWLVPMGSPCGIQLYNIEYLGEMVLIEPDSFEYVEKYFWNEFGI